MTFAQALRAARQAAGLTRWDLAALVGSSKTHIGQIETGADRPSRALLGALAAELPVDPDAFCATLGYLAPDLEAWLVAHPRVVAQIRERMGRGAKKEAA